MFVFLVIAEYYFANIGYGFISYCITGYAPFPATGQLLKFFI